MEILEDKKNCCGCYACFNACPVQAIEMVENEEGFIFPKIDDKKCIHCGKCKKSCPILNATTGCEIEKAYASFASNIEERMTSSSGGIFAVLAKKILEENGIVCGAAFDDNMSVYHLCIENVSDLYKLKGTKYVQSRVEGTYLQIQEYLKNGRKVLFSGTPCQVAGLKAFLGEDKDNLYCIDLICHGVPSPKVWEAYLRELGNGQKVINVNFRQKEIGSNKTYLKYIFENGEEILELKESSLYMKGFIQNLFLRESCFSCKFKGKERTSDITIGDFWSIHEFHSSFADKSGNSAVIINSKKGQQLFEDVSKELKYEKATLKEIAYWNECLNESTVFTEKREHFYSRWKESTLMELLEELTYVVNVQKKESKVNQLLGRAKSKVKRILYE